MSQSTFLFAGRMLAFAFAFPVPFVLVRVITPEQFALYRQLLVLHGTLLSILNLGLSQALFYFVPRYSSDRALPIFHTLAGLLLLSGTGGAALVLLREPIAEWLNNPELAHYLPYLAVFTVLSVITTTLEMLMLSVKHVKLAAWTSLQSELLRSGAMLAAAVMLHSVLAVLLALTFWSGCRLVALVVYLRHLGLPWWTRPRWSLAREQLAYSIPFAMAVIAANLAENLHQYAVMRAYAPAMFAVYSVGYLQIPIVSIAFEAVSDVALVRVTELARDGLLQDASGVIADSVGRLALLLYPLYVFLLINAHDVITLLYTSRFEASVSLFAIFVTLVPVEAVSLNYVPRAFADTRFLFVSQVARLVAITALLLVLIPAFGLHGAAFAVVLALAFHKGLIVWRVGSLLGIPAIRVLPWSQLARTAGAAGLAGLAALVARELSVPGQAARLAVSGVVFALCYPLASLLVGGNQARFVRSAARSLKRAVSRGFPRLYGRATSLLDRILAETRTLRRIGLRGLLPRPLGRRSRWHDELPVQAPRRLVVPQLQVARHTDLTAYLESIGAPYSQGGHTVYLAPEAARATAFRDILRGYPEDAGLKIVKTPGGVTESSYINPENSTGRGDSRLHAALVHGHPHLSLVANLFFSKGIGPRLYDLVELQCGATLWTAYVIAHVEGRVPSTAEREAGIEAIRQLERRQIIRVTLPMGFDDEEFQSPTCMGNALVTRGARFQYFDFQNFRLVGYGKYLKDRVLGAAKDTHIGDPSLLRGGRYLYQTVPGVDVVAKRDTAARMAVVERLLDSASVSFAERLVLDFGCNIGVMMAQYLKLGARWCHGWDREPVIRHTQEILLALGCTRFSTTGGSMSPARPIEADLPAFLDSQLDGCAISYLAVRGHFDWLAALGRIPWSFMLYEGHEEETVEDFHRHVARLSEIVPVKVAGLTQYQDGDCDDRILAVLVRVGGQREPGPGRTGSGASPEESR